ncbi:MAG: LOG family protein [bacterium]
MNDTEFWRQKTYKNPVFLNSPEARQIRILCELTAPKAQFEKNHIENTIVFFGSARSIPFSEATKNLAAVTLEKETAGAPSQDIEDRLAKAKAALKLSEFYDHSAHLAQKLTEWSLTIPDKIKRFYICSGGGPGMMEAANLGASQAKGDSIGLNISLPFEQAPNPYQSTHLSFEFHYFFIRKFWFAYLAKALVAFPGGFGTMDELFELLTLIQTRKIKKTVPIVLFGKEFWQNFINFEFLVEWGVINKQDLDLFRFFDDVDEAFVYLRDILGKTYL